MTTVEITREKYELHLVKCISPHQAPIANIGEEGFVHEECFARVIMSSRSACTKWLVLIQTILHSEGNMCYMVIIQRNNM